MPTTKKDTKPTQKKSAKQGLVNAEYLAKVLNMSARNVRLLTADKIIPAINDGRGNRYDLTEAVPAYIKTLQAKVDKTKIKDLEAEKLDAEIDLKRAKARKAQLELRELEGNMHSASDVESVMTDLIIAMRSALLSMPGQLAVDLAALETAPECSARIKVAAHERLEEIANYKYDPEIYHQRVMERQGWSGNNGDEDDEDMG